MNYIKEMNAFYNRLETNPLSAAAVNLWYALMHINNKVGWAEKFSVAVTVLGVKTSLSESALKRARTELRDKGYIHYRSQGGNRAATYEMMSLVFPDERQATDPAPVRLDDNSDGSVNGKVSDKPDGNTGALVKQNNPKQNKQTTTDAHKFYLDKFGEMNSHINAEIMEYVNDSSEPLVIAAMKRAIERGVVNWRYVKGILKAWIKKGFCQVNEVMEEQAAFVKQKQWHPHRTNQSQEIVPDWFKQQKQKEKADEIQQSDKKQTVDYSVAQKKVARLLAEYGGPSAV